MKMYSRLFAGILTFALVVALGAAAFAQEAAAPAVAETAQTETTDDAALEEAFEALRNARQEERLTDMEEELKELVTAGKLTQEQADKILAYCKERMESRQADMPGMGMGRRGSNGRGMGCGFMNMNGGRQRNGKGNGFGMGLGGGRWNKP